MSAQLIRLYPENPEGKKIRQVADVLRSGGVVIYPTDTIYGIGCDIHNPKAVERVAKIKGMKAEKANFAFICYDLSHIAEYAKVSTTAFKVMKKALPGPFTFILDASSKVPKLMNINKKQVGIRVPDNNIPRQIVQELGNPILTTSIRDEDEVLEYSTDPELIYEKFRDQVDIVIDGGYGSNIPSTIIDCNNDSFEVIRQGLGNIDLYL
jgi:tRNA threonylcarbamoyl adenosine modification protein (Sua5/YciO/YrdC/YwlC family)